MTVYWTPLSGPLEPIGSGRFGRGHRAGELQAAFIGVQQRAAGRAADAHGLVRNPQGQAEPGSADRRR